MIFAAAELLDWAYYLIKTPPLDFGVSLCIAAVLGLLLLRVVSHLIYAGASLVTTAYDAVPEARMGIELDESKFPRVFAAVREVAADVSAPAPDEIRVSSDPETLTVELRQFGISTQRRLVMILSLPQLAIMSAAELRVILAHELSHFRDTWVRVFLSRFLDFLRRSAKKHRWRRWVDPIYWFDWLYFRMSDLLATPIQRHQELRADCRSAAAYGGDFAARTLLKDWLLQNQYLIAETSYHSEGGSDNFFAWFRERWRDFSPDAEDYLLRRLEAEEKPSFWDPDPTTAQRVYLMRTYPPKGIPSPSPARELFDDFSDIERQLHATMY
jgi:Zn-dependent protease with chaperone function